MTSLQNAIRAAFKHTKVRRTEDTDVCFCDPDFDANCGYMSLAEVAILAKLAAKHPGDWCDIGGHTGWTGAHIAAAHPDNYVHIVDPAYEDAAFFNRCLENLRACGVDRQVVIAAQTSDEFFADVFERPKKFDGICIDGHHTHPHPLRDAENAIACLKKGGVIFFHDTGLQSVTIAVNRCRAAGMKVVEHGTMWGIASCQF